MTTSSLGSHSSSTVNPSSFSATEEKNKETKISTITKIAIAALVIFVVTIVTVPTCLSVFTVATPALIGIIVPALFVTFVSGAICGAWAYQTVKNWLEEDDVSNILSSPNVNETEEMEEMQEMEEISPELKAKISELTHGITNPSCNCFMNAMLQNIFSFDDLSKYFLEKLDQIAKDEALASTNPYAFDSTLVKVSKPKDMADEDYEEYKKEQIASIKPWDLVNITSKSIEGIIKDHFDSERDIEQFYISLSLKNAASYALEIINKWRSKKDISGEEAKLLRVALIKVMNLKITINVTEPATKDSEAKVDIKIPGIDQGISISSNRQECPSEFFNSLITSLKDLTKSSSPTTIQSEHKVERFYPSPDDKTAPFSEELKKSTDITKEEDDFLSISITESYSEVDLSHKLIFENKYETAKLKGKEEDIKKSYDFSLPEILIVQAITNDYTKNAKFHDTKYKFTDEENLRIYFPLSKMNKTEKTYELKSFIVHVGNNPYYGHYINYRKITLDDGVSYWICQNDSTCSLVSVDKVKSILNGDIKDYGPAILSFKKI